LELPGGLIDAGMAPEEAARAELRQETGYGGGDWTELGRLAPLPAVFTNHVHVFVARGVRSLGDPDLDPAEDITTQLVLMEDARRMVARGEIVHAPMVGALFLWELEAGVRASRPTPTPTPAPAAIGTLVPAPMVPETGAGQNPGEVAGSLRDRVTGHLRSHFAATVATFGPERVEVEAADAAGAHGPVGGTGGQEAAVGSPHAATVFYALDRRDRLVFLSKADSRHGRHIGPGAPVAVTVAREYTDWREIQGVQLWGHTEPLRGLARARALAVYLARFPFVSALLEDPRLAGSLRGVEVYRITPRRAALTDNRLGPFGREVAEDL
jgi:uncharacterized protein YhbP (UPF0306 family)